MAKFKCILSGNVIEFTQQVDIDSMVGHEGYELVVEEQASVKPATPAKKATKPASTEEQ